MPIQVQAALLTTQHPNNEPGKAVENWSKYLSSCTLVRKLDENLTFAWFNFAMAAICGVNQWMEALYLSFPLFLLSSSSFSNFAFQINDTSLRNNLKIQMFAYKQNFFFKQKPNDNTALDSQSRGR